MREALKLPREYQLYSLRDRYANHIDESLIERINKIAPEF